MITLEKRGSASILVLFILNYVTKLLQPISEYKQTALEHFDHNQLEGKMDDLELIQQPALSINNLDTEVLTVFLSKKRRGDFPPMMKILGGQISGALLVGIKRKKLAKNPLKVGKTRLNYNESEVENIVKLYKELQEFDKKTVSFGLQFKPFTTSSFGARRSGHIGVEKKSTGGFMRILQPFFCHLSQKYPRQMHKLTTSRRGYTSRYKLMLNDYEAI